MENPEMVNDRQNKARVGGITFVLVYTAFLLIFERKNLGDISTWLRSLLPFIICTYFLGQIISQGKNYSKGKKWLFVAIVTIIQVIIIDLLHYLDPEYRNVQFNYFLNKPELFFKIYIHYLSVTFGLLYPANLMISKFIFWKLEKK